LRERVCLDCVTEELTMGSECDWVNEGSEGQETRKVVKERKLGRKGNYIAEF